jgi:purine-cytosine permease-like protein
MRWTKKNVALAVGAPAGLLAFFAVVSLAKEKFGDLAWQVPALVVMLVVLGWAAVEGWGDK